MIKALSGAPESKYKAALRNVLLMNIMSHSYEPTEDPNKMKRYQFNWKKGLLSIILFAMLSEINFTSAKPNLIASFCNEK